MRSSTDFCGVNHTHYNMHDHGTHHDDHDEHVGDGHNSHGDPLSEQLLRFGVADSDHTENAAKSQSSRRKVESHAHETAHARSRRAVASTCELALLTDQFFYEGAGEWKM